MLGLLALGAKLHDHIGAINAGGARERTSNVHRQVAAGDSLVINVGTYRGDHHLRQAIEL